MASVPFAFWLAKTAKDVRAYVEDCYGNQTIQQIPYVCAYALEQILYSRSPNQPCPFDESICLGGPENSLTIDTDLLDSHVLFALMLRNQRECTFAGQSRAVSSSTQPTPTTPQS